MFSNTGSTDLRLTEVQQPKTTATLSWSSSCLAFSAKRSQLEAGSTTTGWSLRPSTPPLALISSTAISTTSRSETSLMAIVPDERVQDADLDRLLALRGEHGGEAEPGGEAGAGDERAPEKIAA